MDFYSRQQGFCLRLRRSWVRWSRSHVWWRRPTRSHTSAAGEWPGTHAGTPNADQHACTQPKRLTENPDKQTASVCSNTELSIGLGCMSYSTVDVNHIILPVWLDKQCQTPPQCFCPPSSPTERQHIHFAKVHVILRQNIWRHHVRTSIPCTETRQQWRSKTISKLLLYNKSITTSVLFHTALHLFQPERSWIRNNKKKTWAAHPAGHIHLHRISSKKSGWGTDAFRGGACGGSRGGGAFTSM